MAARRRNDAARELKLLRIFNVAQTTDESAFKKLADSLYKAATE
jgi:hypothetical protein